MRDAELLGALPPEIAEMIRTGRARFFAMADSPSMRQRRARERRRRGVKITPLEISDEQIERLLAQGLIAKSDLDDPEALAFSLNLALDVLLGIGEL